MVYDYGHLHSALSSKSEGFFLSDTDVIRHISALHQYPGLSSDEVKDTDVGPGTSFFNPHHFAFASAVASLLLGNCYCDDVSVQSIFGFGCFYINVILLPVHTDKDKTFSGHLDFSCELWTGFH